MKTTELRPFIAFACLALACAGKSTLQEKYPFARLTPDYGILTEEDLRISEEDASPGPLNPDNMAYKYWQCFPVKQIVFGCRIYPKQKGVPMADITIEVKSGGRYEEYGGRRPVPLAGCRNESVVRWKELSKGETYACISGHYGSQDAKIKNLAGNFVTGRFWTYDRFKTRKGCTSWFIGDCKFKNLNKNSKK